MAQKIRNLLYWLAYPFMPQGPDDGVRAVVNLMIVFSPFLVIGLWPRRYDYGLFFWMAFVNRMYWRIFKEQNEDMHAHCPQCGYQFKEEVVRQ